jgi:O-antigen ligase
VIGEQPFLGYGYQASRPLVLRIAPWAGDAHNGFLQTLLDIGIIGAALLWVPFIAVLVLAIKHAAELRTLVAWPLGALLGAALFEFVNALSNVSVAGAPGIALALVVTCVILADQIWLRDSRAAASPATSWPADDAVLGRPVWSRDRRMPTARG